MSREVKRGEANAEAVADAGAEAEAGTDAGAGASPWRGYGKGGPEPAHGGGGILADEACAVGGLAR